MVAERVLCVMQRSFAAEEKFKVLVSFTKACRCLSSIVPILVTVMSRCLSGKDKQSPAISVPTLMAGHKKSFSGRFRQTKKPVFFFFFVPLGKTGQYLHTTLTLLFHSEKFPTGVFRLFCEFQTKHCKVRQSHKPLLKKEKLPFS